MSTNQWLYLAILQQFLTVLKNSLKVIRGSAEVIILDLQHLDIIKNNILVFLLLLGWIGVIEPHHKLPLE